MKCLTFPANELDTAIIVPVNLVRVVRTGDRICAGPNLAIGNGKRILGTVGRGGNQTFGLGVLVSGLETIKVPVAYTPALDLACGDSLIDPIDELVDR